MRILRQTSRHYNPKKTQRFSLIHPIHPKSPFIALLKRRPTAFIRNGIVGSGVGPCRNGLIQINDSIYTTSKIFVRDGYMYPRQAGQAVDPRFPFELHEFADETGATGLQLVSIPKVQVANSSRLKNSRGLTTPQYKSKPPARNPDETNSNHPRKCHFQDKNSIATNSQFASKQTESYNRMVMPNRAIDYQGIQLKPYTLKPHNGKVSTVYACNECLNLSTWILLIVNMIVNSKCNFSYKCDLIR